MKLQYFLFHGLFVLIFGLVSCSPDGKGTSAQGEVAGVAVVNTDKSQLSLTDLSEPSLTSKFNLDINAGPGQSFYTRFTTDCQTNYLDEIAAVSVDVHNTKTVAFTEILPIAIYTPTSITNPSTYCNINATIYINQQPRGEINLANLRIKDVSTYANFKLPFPNSVESNFHHLKQITALMLSAPMSETKITTLCKESNKANLFFNSQIAMTELFDETLFTDSNIIHCRFVTESTKSLLKWISEPFRVQYETPKLTTRILSNFKGQSTNDWMNESMLTVEITNPTPHPLYVTLSNRSSSVKLVPVYVQALGNQLMSYNAPTVLAAEWVLDGGILQAEKDIKNPIYLIPPQQTAQLNLITKQRIHCLEGVGNLGNDPTTPSKCSATYLAGVLNMIQSVPNLSFNGFSTMEKKQWQKVSLESVMHKSYPMGYQYWAPNFDFPPHCPPKKVVTKIQGKIELIETGSLPGRLCELL